MSKEWCAQVSEQTLLQMANTSAERIPRERIFSISTMEQHELNDRRSASKYVPHGEGQAIHENSGRSFRFPTPIADTTAIRTAPKSPPSDNRAPTTKAVQLPTPPLPTSKSRVTSRFGGIRMIQAVIALFALLTLIGMSLRANRKFAGERRLPMQWSMSGTVNWTAPRPLALSFTPILAGLVLVAATAATIMTEPRPGQEGMAVPVILFLSAAFLAVHSLHLRLISKLTNPTGS